MNNIIDIIFIVLLVVAAVPLAHFIYRYARYSPWRTTRIGTTLMYQKIAMLSMIILSILARFMGDYTARPYITLVVFIALVTLFWRTDIELVRAQQDFPRRDNWKAFWAAPRKKK